MNPACSVNGTDPNRALFGADRIENIAQAFQLGFIFRSGKKFRIRFRGFRVMSSANSSKFLLNCGCGEVLKVIGRLRRVR